jgi:hypothetical protein
MSTYYTYPKELQNILVLTFAGMLSYYGIGYEKDIFNAFNKSLITMAREDEKKDAIVSYESTGIVFKPAAFFVTCQSTFDGKIAINRSVKIYDFSYCDDKKVLSSIVHEINHVLHTMRSPICKRQSDLFLRIGLYLNSLINQKKEGLALEETINTLETADIMNNIFYFKNFKIEDIDISNAINKYFRKFKLNETFGYDCAVSTLKPLYYDKNFKDMIKECRLNGDLITIRHDFDSKVGENAYYELCNNMENISTDFSFSNKREINSVNAKIKTYLKNR